MKVIQRRFYERDTIVVSKQLLGKYLVRKLNEGTIIGRIIEVEAYKGKHDPASYAYRGFTSKSKLMFEHGGLAFIVPVHAHLCFNVTTEKVGIPGAVLIRAVEPVKGFEIVRRNLGKEDVKLIDGPGKLTRALEITQDLNGLDLTKSKALFLCYPEVKEKFKVFCSSRIGVKGGENRQWRFYIKRGNPAHKNSAEWKGG
jgi:DNA-3-methyladenine glycosylase